MLCLLSAELSFTVSCLIYWSQAINKDRAKAICRAVFSHTTHEYFYFACVQTYYPPTFTVTFPYLLIELVCLIHLPSVCLSISSYKIRQWEENDNMTSWMICRAYGQFLKLVRILLQKKNHQDLLMMHMWILRYGSKALRWNSVKLHHYRKHSSSRICPPKLVC